METNIGDKLYCLVCCRGDQKENILKNSSVHTTNTLALKRHTVFKFIQTASTFLCFSDLKNQWQSIQYAQADTDLYACDDCEKVLFATLERHDSLKEVTVKVNIEGNQILYQSLLTIVREIHEKYREVLRKIKNVPEKDLIDAVSSWNHRARAMEKSGVEYLNVLPFRIRYTQEYELPSTLEELNPTEIHSVVDNGIGMHSIPPVIQDYFNSRNASNETSSSVCFGTPCDVVENHDLVSPEISRNSGNSSEQPKPCSSKSVRSHFMPQQQKSTDTSDVETTQIASNKLKNQTLNSITDQVTGGPAMRTRRKSMTMRTNVPANPSSTDTKKFSTHFLNSINKELCPVCDKPLSKKSVAAHLKIVHAGIKEFECDLCGKKFAQIFNLNRHKGNKPCLKKWAELQLRNTE